MMQSNRLCKKTRLIQKLIFRLSEERCKILKLKCHDGVTRRFYVCEFIKWANSYTEAKCADCGELFGVHDTKILKPIFKKHQCNSVNSSV